MIDSTRRTAGCGPACPVVWQGCAGNRVPYAYSRRWVVGVSRERTRLLVGESPTGVKRLRPCSLGGAVERKRDGGALRQHTLKGACAKHQVAM